MVVDVKVIGCENNEAVNLANLQKLSLKKIISDSKLFKLLLYHRAWLFP